MSEPMTPERPRCGTPCLKHAHACDRSPRHTGFHRDVQQKGEHTCEWDAPHPKDFPALMTALRGSRVEVERLRAELDADRAVGNGAKHWHDTYQQSMNAVDEFLGVLLDLLPGATDEGMDAYDQIPRGIEKLRAELDEVRGVLVRELRASFYFRTAWRSARQGRKKVRTELWQMTTARDVFVELMKDAEAERDEARAAQQRSDELLVGAHNDLCEALGVRHRPLLDVIQHAATVAEQVKRATNLRLIRFAIADPGAFTKREKSSDGDYETVPAWSARAVVLAVQKGGEQRG